VRQAQIDRYFTPYRSDGAPGIALAVYRGGEPVLIRTHGRADLAAGIAVTPATNFRLASITKQFTAACILLLAGRGALRLDATLANLLDGFPDFGKTISVRDLLHHTSGLVDYETLIAPDFSGQVSDRDVHAIARQSDHTYFEPGSRFRYSNTGYALLAVIVEEVSGRGFASFARENIFEPLGMYGTVAFEDGVSIVENRALGYTADDDGTAVLSDQDATSAVLGDGGIYSSVLDYGKWDRALYVGDLLSQDTLESMWTPSLGGYGFGWRIDTLEGHRRLHHEGFSCGFQNHVMRFPERQATVLVLSNRREPPVQPIAEAVARLYL
jgi:CubicO group peptidase (beta-lactamase class C family)